MLIRKWIFLALIFIPSISAVNAQTFAFRKNSTVDTIPLSQTMPEFAEAVLSTYREEDQDKLLVNKMRLQMVAGKYHDALVSIKSVRQLRTTNGDAQAATAYLVYEIFAEAMLKQSATISFDSAFKQSFRDIYGRLDNRTAAEIQWIFGASLARAEADLTNAVEKAGVAGNVGMADALDLVRRFQFLQVYSRISPLVDTVMLEDETRRYSIEKGLQITMPDGIKIEALVVRPNAVKNPLTTLLSFTIYANDDWSLSDAKTAASYGYIGVVAYTRGKGAGSSGPIIPYEYDGQDAAGVINWISRQPWSDGKVGMYGNSYNSFTQWAAAKHRPPALKALMTSGSAAPGIDVPMQGGIFQNFMYPWPFYTTNNKSLDDETYQDSGRWSGLYQNWYKAGSAYREMDAIDGKANPVFRRWLEHPDYDTYWQRMIPYRNEFADIDIPVLAVTGYFDGARVGVQYYYDQHMRYNPKADHTLLIGPFEHLSINAGVARNVEGYDIDQAGLINLQALRYEWFDHIFKGTPKPELLKDHVNYEVMGGNEWKHAPSLQAMANDVMRFYLQPGIDGNNGRLSDLVPAKKTLLMQRIDFSDRSDMDWAPPELAVTKLLDTHNGIAFISEPIAENTEISGLMTGKLDFITNKRDVDLAVTLYEKMENGDYFQLTYHLGRVSYAKDRSKRQLLKPGKRNQVDFRSERLVSRKLNAGSRLVIVVSVVKQFDQQINYGTGKDVSDETITDAATPLEIIWRNTSYVELPVWRENSGVK